MDTAPRSAFIAAVLLPHERTAVMGMINVVKTLSQSVGPSITGLLGERNLFWVAFVTSGVIKITYDLGLLAAFAGHVSREDEDRDRDPAAAEEEERGEEQESADEV